MGWLPTVLAEHSGLVPVALVAVVVGCAVLGRLVRDRPRALVWASGLALFGVLGLTLAPDDRGRVSRVQCEVAFSLPSWGSGELLANVALFVPVAVFTVLLFRRPLLVAVTGAAVSAVIEGVQALAVVLGRSCTTSDWAMNTAGTVLGVAVGVGVLAVGRVTARG